MRDSAFSDRGCGRSATAIRKACITATHSRVTPMMHSVYSLLRNWPLPMRCSAVSGLMTQLMSSLVQIMDRAAACGASRHSRSMARKRATSEAESGEELDQTLVRMHHAPDSTPPLHSARWSLRHCRHGADANQPAPPLWSQRLRSTCSSGTGEMIDRMRKGTRLKGHVKIESVELYQYLLMKG